MRSKRLDTWKNCPKDWVGVCPVYRSHMVYTSCAYGRRRVIYIHEWPREIIRKEVRVASEVSILVVSTKCNLVAIG